MKIAVATEDRRGESVCCMNMGVAHWHLGNHEQAIEYSERALDIAKEIGDLDGERIVNLSLGRIHCACSTGTTTRFCDTRCSAG